ncbi:MAG: hypothetical protein Tsb007_37460 [Rhizobacter sp.]
MKASVKRRSKPAVADQNRKNAEANIRNKVAILCDLVEILSHPAADAAKKFERELLDRCLYPKSVRQFNAWKTASLPADLRELAPAFATNANATLVKNEELYASCRQVVSALHQHRLVLARRPTREDSLNRTRHRLTMSNTLRQIIERQYAVLLVRNSEMRGAVEQHEARYQSLSREVSDALRARDEEIADLRKKNAELVSASLKVTGLRGRHDR